MTAPSNSATSGEKSLHRAFPHMRQSLKDPFWGIDANGPWGGLARSHWRAQGGVLPRSGIDVSEISGRHRVRQRALGAECAPVEQTPNSYPSAAGRYLQRVVICRLYLGARDFHDFGLWPICQNVLDSGGRSLHLISGPMAVWGDWRSPFRPRGFRLALTCGRGGDRKKVGV